MTTLHLPTNLPKPTFEEIRRCPIRSRIDDMWIRFGINPPPIDGRDMILHISDTPSTMFPYIRRALQRLRPAWVVHTGDLVDDVKLETRPALLGVYRKKLAKLISIFEEESCEAIFLTGNHDDLASVLELTERSSIQVWSRPGRFYIGSFRFRAGHAYSDVLTESGDYNLFGHNLEHLSMVDGAGHFYLNGLEEMHMIHMQTGDVIPVRYPPGTNDARLDRKRVSL